MLLERTFAAWVLLLCAASACASAERYKDQKDQYAGYNKGTSSTTATSDKKISNHPQEMMFADQPPSKDLQVPLRHTRKGCNPAKNQKKLRTRNYGLSWQAPTPALPPAYYYSSWAPAAYTINRPYFIPTWGPVGGVPIFFPPQPLFINPQYTKPNREYLPPYENPPSDTTPPPYDGDIGAPDISNKFGGDGDDAPVWDREEAPARPPRPSSGSKRVMPTRRPRPMDVPTSTFPPVVHRPTTEEVVVNNLSAPKEGNKVVEETQPVVTNAPGRCVWAIISCCSGAAQEVTNTCFEQLGCSGPFWDKSPCDSEFAKAAINAALEYYKGG